MFANYARGRDPSRGKPKPAFFLLVTPGPVNMEDAAWFYAFDGFEPRMESCVALRYRRSFPLSQRGRRDVIQAGRRIETGKDRVAFGLHRHNRHFEISVEQNEQRLIGTFEDKVSMILIIGGRPYRLTSPVAQSPESW